MKNKSPIIILSLCVCTTLSLVLGQFLIYQSVKGDLNKQTGEVEELQEEIESLYVLSIIQGRQIQTLFNVEIRNLSPKIQERLDAIRKDMEERSVDDIIPETLDTDKNIIPKTPSINDIDESFSKLYGYLV
jgi:hypothetical protein|tara:strand:+ start:712 stop:1104 length:393 start_codon:yes stop_codon:yes gene_type:complete